MQNTWLGIALMALVIVAGVVIGIKMSKGVAQRRAVIAAFVVMTLVIAVFFAVAIVLSQQGTAPLFAIACLVLPAAAYALVVRSAGKKAGARAAQRPTTRRSEGRASADVPKAPGTSVAPAMAPLPTYGLDATEGQKNPVAYATVGEAAEEPGAEIEPASRRSQQGFAPEPPAPAVEDRTFEAEDEEFAADAAAVLPQTQPAEEPIADAFAATPLPQVESAGTRVADEPDFLPAQAQPDGERDTDAADKETEPISESESELAPEPEQGLEANAQLEISQPQQDFTPEPAAPAVGGVAAVSAPEPPAPAVEGTAAESVAAATATPAPSALEVEPVIAPTPYEKLSQKAGVFKGRDQYTVAARLFAEAAGCAPDATSRRQAKFDELSCYVKADDAEKALALAVELHKSSVLTRVERIKLDAVARMK